MREPLRLPAPSPAAGQPTIITFHQDTLTAIETEEGVFVAVKPIAEALGLDWRAQHRRITLDPVLSEGMAVMTIPSAGGDQETTMLRLGLVNGWLFTIDDRRVKPEARAKVLTYKRECHAALFRHFHGTACPAAIPLPDGSGDDRLLLALVATYRRYARRGHTQGLAALAQRIGGIPPRTRAGFEAKFALAAAQVLRRDLTIPSGPQAFVAGVLTDLMIALEETGHG